jgi:hypothetical protein
VTTVSDPQKPRKWCRCFRPWRGASRRPTPAATAIRAYINGWTNRARLFVWTKTADEILKKANRQTTSNAGH